jgi:hypothetical protein
MKEAGEAEEPVIQQDRSHHRPGRSQAPLVGASEQSAMVGFQQDNSHDTPHHRPLNPSVGRLAVKRCLPGIRGMSERLNGRTRIILAQRWQEQESAIRYS